MRAARRPSTMGTMPSPAASRVLTALAAGLTTTAYYATPDVIHSRTARGWAKAGVAAASVAVELPQLRAELPQLRAGLSRLRAGLAQVRAGDPSVDDRPEPTGPSGGAEGTVLAEGDPRVLGAPHTGCAVGAGGVERSPSPAARARVVALGVVGVAFVGSVVGTVAADRWLFRRGEARAAEGVRFAHTRTAAVLGALTVALALIPPTPDEAGAGGADAGGADVREA